MHYFLADLPLPIFNETLNDWTPAINENKLVIAAYIIDYSLAFDTVSHRKLLNKLVA
jgi:hypothetical protein